MIHRIARIDAPPAVVRGIFHDFEAWPQWMSGVTANRILERGPDRLLAQVWQSALGRIWKQKIDVRLAGDRVRVRALDGWFRWCAEWSFRQAPGGGTTLSLELESEAGLLQTAGRRLFEKAGDRSFDATATQLARRARRLSSREAEPVTGRSLLTVYETADGFEVWYAGRKFVTRERAQPASDAK